MFRIGVSLAATGLANSIRINRCGLRCLSNGVGAQLARAGMAKPASMLQARTTMMRSFTTATISSEQQENGWQAELSGGAGVDRSLLAEPTPTNVIWLCDVFSGSRLRTLYRFYFKREGLMTELREVEAELRRQLYPRVNVMKIVASFKQQGCFLHFKTPQEAERALSIKLKAINKRDVRMFMVQGVPFVEDYLWLYPTSNLKCTFRKGALFQQEAMFVEFRQFGRLRSIEISDDKKSCVVRFLHLRDAIAAQNCLHQKHYGDEEKKDIMSYWTSQADVLSVRYVQTNYLNKLWAAVVGTKLGMLLLALATAIASFLILAPLRNYFVTQRLVLGYSEPYFDRELDLEETLTWRERSDAEAELRRILSARPAALTVLSGERGTEKSVLVRKVLNRRSGSVRVDCSEVRSVQDFIDTLEATISFRPSFSGINQVRGYLESMLAFGKGKQGMEDTKQEQLREILQTLRNGFLALSMRYPRLDDDSEFNYSVIVFDGFHRLVESMEAQSKAEALKAQELLDTLVQWADHTATQGLANVVFVTDNVYAEDQLKKRFTALRGRMHTVEMRDAPRAKVEQYLRVRLATPSDADIAKCYDWIGGRVAHMETLVEQYASQPDASLDDVVQQMARDETLAFKQGAFGSVLFTDAALKSVSEANQLPWSQYQIWQIMRAIAGVHEKLKSRTLTVADFEMSAVSYDEALLGIFRGDEEAVRRLVQANLLSVREDAEHRRVLVTHSPLQQRVVQRLVLEDRDFRLGMDGMCALLTIKKVEKEIVGLEEELVRLQKGNVNASERRRDLERRLKLLNGKVSRAEKVLEACLGESKLAVKARWQ